MTRHILRNDVNFIDRIWYSTASGQINLRAAIIRCLASESQGDLPLVGWKGPKRPFTAIP